MFSPAFAHRHSCSKKVLAPAYHTSGTSSTIEAQYGPNGNLEQHSMDFSLKIKSVFGDILKNSLGWYLDDPNERGHTPGWKSVAKMSTDIWIPCKLLAFRTTKRWRELYHVEPKQPPPPPPLPPHLPRYRDWEMLFSFYQLHLCGSCDPRRRHCNGEINCGFYQQDRPIIEGASKFYGFEKVCSYTLSPAQLKPATYL